MKVAISSSSAEMSAPLDPRFGRAPYFLVIDLESGAVRAIDNAARQSAGQGAGIQAAKAVVDAGARAVLTGEVGPRALTALQGAGVTVYRFAGVSVRDALEQFKTHALARPPRAAAPSVWHWNQAFFKE